MLFRSRVTGVNTKTGETFETEANDISDSFIKSMAAFEISETGVKRLIDNLNISADAKLALHAVTNITIKAGELVLKIGRKIIDFICTVFNEFPNASFGMIFGLIMGALISAIPIIGAVFSPIVMPIVLALGITIGMKEDLKDKALARKIAEINSSFSPLSS